MSIPLPTSSNSPYFALYWTEIEVALSKLEKKKTLESLEKTVLKFLNKTKLDRSRYVVNCPEADGIMNHNRLSNLKAVLKSLADDTILKDVIPAMCRMALQMPDLFPTKDLKILEASTNGSVSLNRAQIACLLAHMFFCTILPCSYLKKHYNGHFVGDAAPTGPITFRFWHTTSSGPTKLYLNVIINYFKEVALKSRESLESEIVLFERKTLSKENKINWKYLTANILEVNIHQQGLIGDIEGHVEMDFANKNVGFGTTGTQEELILGCSPDSCPLVLFTETLGPEDAVMIQGAKKYGTYKGYGVSARYTGPFPEQWDWSQRKIVAMDALAWIGDEIQQLNDDNLKRELDKAFCAFSLVPSAIIDTGHWGCGAFGGNKGIKSVIQLMAASAAQSKQLEFYCFGDSKFHDYFVQCCEAIRTKGVTIANLWTYLKEYELQVKTSKFQTAVESYEFGVLVWLKEKLK